MTGHKNMGKTRETPSKADCCLPPKEKKDDLLGNTGESPQLYT